MSKVIFIQGLPGSGKTTLATLLKERLDAIHVNADWARGTITSHLGFKESDRVKQATTLGQLARMLHSQGHWVIVDFVCPLKSTRNAFLEQFLERSDVFSVWMNTITESRFADTNKMYVKPSDTDVNYEINHYCDTTDFDEYTDDIATLSTLEHEKFYIRYNTHSDGDINMWRVINANTMEERLYDEFELRGHLTPATTVEHGVTKWNVQVVGVPRIEGKKFIITY